MLCVGFAAVWGGGLWFRELVGVICGLMVWELARMVVPGRSTVAIGAATGALALIFLVPLIPTWLSLVLALGWVIGFAAFLKPDGLRFGLLSLGLLFACHALDQFRGDAGLVWMGWFALVVIVVDIGGYFGGRLIGGPKILPRISPKKTWSGTVSGWIGAVLVGAAFAIATSGGAGIVLASFALAVASQAGDMAESAIKRRAGVKDSSNLLPGHGGLMDRFDGMVGAAILLLFLAPILDLPAMP